MEQHADWSCATSTTHRSIVRHVRGGMLVICSALSILGSWAFNTSIAGAVIALGQVVVNSDSKKIQHPTGGVVREIRVRNGAAVQQGEVLLVLDETVTNANLAMVSKSLAELMMRRARLVAERDSLTQMNVPDLGDLPADVFAQAMRGEQALLERRYAARQSAKDQLRQRIRQGADELAGLRAQLTAKLKELELVGKELRGAETLWQKSLISVTKYHALQREAARLGGEQGQLIAGIALTEGKSTETELRILQIEADFGSEVGKELREVEYRINELIEKRVAAQDQLRRTSIIAPQAGIVHELAVHNVGAVIAPGEVLMLVVPQHESLSAEVRFQPQDIDQLRVGQKATLRFSSFNQSTTPDCPGTLIHLAPDLSTDPRSGAAFYVGRVGMGEEAADCLKAIALVPGMPVEAFLATGDRTIFSYFSKPLSDQMKRAFRAE